MNDEGIFDMHDADSGSKGTADQKTSNDTLKKDRMDLLWVVHFNISLFEDSERYYGFCDSVCRLVTALFGTYAFASLFIDRSIAYSVCGLITAFFSVFSLVVDFKDKQTKSKMQRNRYYNVLAEIESAANDIELMHARKKLSEIAKDDVPTGPVCDALATNAAIDKMGLDVTYKAKVGWFKRLTRFVLPWDKPEYGHR